MVETSLTEMFVLMEKRGKGENGTLITSGYWNIFYVRDSAGVLRAVRVHWCDGGWSVGAVSVTVSHEWGAGDQVVSR